MFTSPTMDLELSFNRKSRSLLVLPKVIVSVKTFSVYYSNSELLELRATALLRARVHTFGNT